MTDLMITNISNKIGPGDIVGAFINEAGIKADQIGNIDLNDNMARVEVEDEVAEIIIDRMQNKTIGSEQVNVRLFSDSNFAKHKGITNYAEKFSNFVEMERKEEMRRHENEIRQLSGWQREQKGRAILHLKGRDQGTGLGNKYLIKFVRYRGGEQLPENEISIGDLVMVSKNDPLADNPTGTVIGQTNYSITVSFDKKPPGFLSKKGLRIDLYVNDITYQRMLEALDKLERASGNLSIMRDKLLGLEDTELNAVSEIVLFNKNLNNSQIKAVQKALAARDFFLIHGPPGTGKTVTCIEVIQQAVAKKETVLATADSNVAVDNIVEWLVKRGVRTVRVGHPARVNPLLREHTLDYMLEDNSTYKEAQELRERAFDLDEEQDQYTLPEGRWRRGLSDSSIRELASKGQTTRNIPEEKIQSMAGWLKIQDKINDYFRQIDELKEQAVNKILNKAEVICCTNSTAGSEIMTDREFDLLVLDEATQATEPSALIPLTKTKRVVMAGDHRQLPPTILNQKAEQEGLAKSLFERLLDIHGNDIKQLLRTQYRMNEKIMEFSSQHFYDQELRAADVVKNWTLDDLEIELPEEPFFDNVFDPEKPVIFLDTVSKEAVEESVKDSQSYRNIVESQFATEILERAIQTGINGSEVALISPYKDQADLIASKIDNESIEIDTVDGFQGREKEIIILSLVRNNPDRNIGFLKDLRRLNVSITRARKKLIIIGDSSTISSNSTYRALIDYIKDKNGYYRLN